MLDQPYRQQHEPEGVRIFLRHPRRALARYQRHRVANSSITSISIKIYGPFLFPEFRPTSNVAEEGFRTSLRPLRFKIFLRLKLRLYSSLLDPLPLESSEILLATNTLQRGRNNARNNGRRARRRQS